MKLKRIVVVNDDGIDAPGLAVAEALAMALADEVWVFAPATDQSGKAQAMTLRQSIKVHERNLRRYAVAGTPADCVMVALGSGLMADRRPDLVISGVNWGYNVSDSVMYSGTAGAALAALHFGLPAMALSQTYVDDESFDFSVSKCWGQAVIEKLWAARQRHGCAWNINFPVCDVEAVAGLRFAHQARGDMQAPRLTRDADMSSNEPPGQTSYLLSFDQGSEFVSDSAADVVALREDYIAAMPLRCERHDEQTLAQVGAGVTWPLEKP